MKQATQFAMIGAGILLFIRIFYIIMSFNFFEYSPNFNMITNVFDLLATSAIFNFFYVLYQKQSNTFKDDE